MPEITVAPGHHLFYIKVNIIYIMGFEYASKERWLENPPMFKQRGVLHTSFLSLHLIATGALCQVKLFVCRGYQTVRIIRQCAAVQPNADRHID